MYGNFIIGYFRLLTELKFISFFVSLTASIYPSTRAGAVDADPHSSKKEGIIIYLHICIYLATSDE